MKSIYYNVLSLVLLSLFGIATLNGQTCPSATLTTQSAIDNFGPCTSINGSLTISGGDITDLTPLTGITSVSQFLTLNGLTNLSTLDGLQDITSVSGLDIVNCDELVNLNGLNDLQTISTNGLTIHNNNNLQSFTGLESLDNINGYFLTFGQDRIKNLSGLDNLTTMNGNLTITFDSLENVDALANLTNLTGSLILRNNPELTSIAGLSGLTAVPSAFAIDNNDKLTNLNGLHNIQSVSGTMTIENNAILDNVDALASIQANPGVLGIVNNVLLNDISGLEDIDLTGSWLKIENNPALSACAMANVCTHLDGGSASIFGNAIGCNSSSEILAACSECSAPSSVWTSVLRADRARIHCTAVQNVSLYRTQYRAVGTSTWTTIGSAIRHAFTLNGLTPDTDYQYRFKAKCNTGTWSDYTDLQVFHTSPCYEVNSGWATNVRPTKVLWNWDSTPDAIVYNVRYRPTAGGAWVKKSRTATLSLIRLFTGLTPSTQYEVQMNIKCPYGKTAWKGMGTFTTAAAAQSVNDRSNQNNLSRVAVWPNPAQDYLFIESEKALHSIQVISINGKLMNSLQTDTEDGVQIQISDLAEGVYYLKIKHADGTQMTEKFLKF